MITFITFGMTSFDSDKDESDEIAGRASVAGEDNRTSLISYSSPSMFKSTEPVCFGELCFLGLQERRSADVIAQSMCQVRILHRAIFLKTLQEHGEALRLNEMSEFLEIRYHKVILPYQ